GPGELQRQRQHVGDDERGDQPDGGGGERRGQLQPDGGDGHEQRLAGERQRPDGGLQRHGQRQQHDDHRGGQRLRGRGLLVHGDERGGGQRTGVGQRHQRRLQPGQ